MADIESLLEGDARLQARQELPRHANWNRKKVKEYRNGSSAASSTSPTTASTGTWRGRSAWRRNKAAIIWEGEPGDTRVLTFGELHREVCKFANVLKGLGVKKGDRVALYMPMIPELAIAMLACTRIGAPHSIVFGGFSAEALRDRINDAGAKLVVTADGGFRRGEPFALKPAVDEALEIRLGREGRGGEAHRPRTSHAIEGRDLWWHELMAEDASAECPPAKLDAEHPLFILYTSGTTGKPKGILHTTGGYLTHVTTTPRRSST